MIRKLIEIKRAVRARPLQVIDYAPFLSPSADFSAWRK
jgi:hypothetical protein